MKFLAKYLRPYYKRMLLGLSVKFTGTIMDLLLPWILAYIIDTVVPLGEVTRIIFWGVVMLIISAIGLVGNIVANRIASGVARDTSESIRAELFTKTMYLSSRQADEYSVPSLESRLTSDTYNVHHLVGAMQRMGVRAPILLIGGIAVTLMLEPVLTLALLGTLPFITLIVWGISKKGIPLYTALQKSVDKMVRVVRENAQGIRVIKALSKTDYESNRFVSVNREVVSREKKAGVTMAATNPLMNAFLHIGLTAVVLLGAYRVNAGVSEAGKIIAFITYFTLISNAMLTITRIFVMYSRGIASAERIKEILETPNDLEVSSPEEACIPEEKEEAIRFKQVSFSYNKKKDNLAKISFGISKGSTLGIIGSTGSGKSTVVKLLMRFYDPDSGVIKINGKDIRCIERETLHSKFGAVFQNDFLYADTIEENICLGRCLTRSQIEKAAEIAQAKEFIEALPDKYEHRLTVKGTNLSGGQKQRLLIARAVAASPEILILDDSSSALDYKTDAKLRRAVKENLDKNTTKVVVAQRISSIMNADMIIVLEQGEIIGCGTHKQLLESCGVYREISDSQLGGALVE